MFFFTSYRIWLQFRKCNCSRIDSTLKRVKLAVSEMNWRCQITHWKWLIRFPYTVTVNPWLYVNGNLYPFLKLCNSVLFDTRKWKQQMDSLIQHLLQNKNRGFRQKQSANSCEILNRGNFWRQLMCFLYFERVYLWLADVNFANSFSANRSKEKAKSFKNMLPSRDARRMKLFSRCADKEFRKLCIRENDGTQRNKNEYEFRTASNSTILIQ